MWARSSGRHARYTVSHHQARPHPSTLPKLRQIAARRAWVRPTAPALPTPSPSEASALLGGAAHSAPSRRLASDDLSLTNDNNLPPPARSTASAAGARRLCTSFMSRRPEHPLSAPTPRPTPHCGRVAVMAQRRRRSRMESDDSPIASTAPKCHMQAPKAQPRAPCPLPIAAFVHPAPESPSRRKPVLRCITLVRRSPDRVKVSPPLPTLTNRVVSLLQRRERHGAKLRSALNNPLPEAGRSHVVYLALHRITSTESLPS